MHKYLLLLVMMMGTLNADSIVHDAWLRQHIKRFEGVRYKQYRCSAGHRTIGIGYNIDSKSAAQLARDLLAIGEVDFNTELSVPQVQMLLTRSIQRAQADAVIWFPDLHDLPLDVKRAIVDLSFNIGRTKLSKFVRLRAALSRRDWVAASDEMMDSRWYRQVGLRAVVLVEMVRTCDEQ